MSKDSPYKLTFTLKQHTPIIHFQHEQAGATLRATEVKPKLDQFLFEKLTGETGFNARKKFHELLFSGTDEQKKWKQWLVGKGKDLKQNMKEDDLKVALRHLAFDYSIKVQTSNVLNDIDLNTLKNFESIKQRNGQNHQKRKNGQPQYDKYSAPIWNRNSFHSFFGNMDKETERKELRMVSNIKLVINSFNPKLIELIRNNFCHFIFQNNFGTRHSKGFGSFSFDRSDNRYNEFLNITKSHRYKFTVNVSNVANEFEKQKRIHSAIELFYKTIRSGINQKSKVGNDFIDVYYFKSLMFQWAKQPERNWQWDKRSIREAYMLYEYSPYHGIKQNRTSQTIHYNSENEMLLRDLLGLSTEQDWIKYKDKISKVHIASDDDSIYRFKSPLIFKPIQFENNQVAVLIIVNSIPENFLNQEFSILSRNSHPAINGNEKRLSTPQSFDVQGFLNWVIEFFANNNSFDESKFDDYVDVSDDDKANREIKLLKGIYNDLIENYYA